MRALLPPSDTPVELYVWYAPPRPDWVRANFIASVDGAASAGGRSRGLQVPADLEVFVTLRAHADVVLVGLGTARTEGYGPVRLRADLQARRRAAGRPGVPTLAVVTNSLAIDDADPLLRAAPLVLTSRAAARPVPGAEVVTCGAAAVDLAAALDALRARGLASVVCEGGPTLYSGLVRAGLVDELCLTVSPLLAGPPAGRIVAGSPWDAAVSVDLIALLTADGALFARYAVRRAPAAGPQEGAQRDSEVGQVDAGL